MQDPETSRFEIETNAGPHLKHQSTIKVEGSGKVASVVLLCRPAVHNEELKVDEFGSKDLVSIDGEAQKGLDLILKGGIGLCEEGGFVT